MNSPIKYQLSAQKVIESMNLLTYYDITIEGGAEKKYLRREKAQFEQISLP